MIPLPQKYQIIKKDNNTASLEIQGLYPGYGTTIGNSLRRVILSSLQGAAITSVKIKGVSHEFSTIPGVLEDVIIILLNLKQLRFKMFTSEPQKATLKVKGERNVIADDFQFPSQVEIINKQAPIATLTSKTAYLEMEVKINQGIGYESVERRGEGKNEVGVISLDATYSPIRKVGFSVENMRVGKRTDFDKLIFEIKTDGTISPEEAFTQGCGILIKHFSLFQKYGEKENPKSSKSVKKKPVAEKAKKNKKDKKDKKDGKSKKGKEDKKGKKSVLKLKVTELGLSAKTNKILIDNNIATISKIVKKTEQEILGLNGVGDKMLKDIKKSLKKLKLILKA